MSPLSTRPRPERMEPLWDRVDRNRLKLAGIVSIFVLGSAIGLGLFAALPVAFVTMRLVRSVSEFQETFWRMIGATTLIAGLMSASWATYTLLRSEKWLLARFDAKLVPKGELMETKFALKDMAIAGGLPVAPALYVIPGWTTNAFVFAARRRRAVIGVTEGFLKKLPVDDQRAVFANLIARIVSGDTIVTTGLAALMWPLQSWRTYRLTETARERRQFETDERFAALTIEGGEFAAAAATGGGIGVYVVFGIGFALLAEVVAAGQRYTQRSSAEKADAEGMLLLKDPASMLSALNRCIALDNAVPVAGETLSELFYCWTGFSSDDEDDPEWERVTRLREVLGVMGNAPKEEAGLDELIPRAPVAPWAEDSDGR